MFRPQFKRRTIAFKNVQTRLTVEINHKETSKKPFESKHVHVFCEQG